MLRPRHEDRRWPRWLRRSWAFAVVVAFVLTLWLPRERAKGPIGDPHSIPAPAPPLNAAAGFSPEGTLLTPPLRGAFVLQCMLAQVLEAHIPPAAASAWTWHAMTADEFRQLYEGDPGDYADLVFDDR